VITIAISNQKGGVGKTTTATTLAHGFALQGLSTVILDLDSQGNVADSLGLESGRELAQILNPMLPGKLELCVVPSTRQNLDVVRSDKTTVALKTMLAGVDFREFVLQHALDKAKYDLCVMDCAPSVDVLHTAALVAADWLIIPTQLDQMAVKGVRDLLVSLADIHRTRRSVCQVAGILPTFYDRVTGESQKQLEHLVRQFKRLVLPPIPKDTVCREASRAGRTLYEYAPNCRAMMGIQLAAKNGIRQAMGGYLAVQARLMEVLNG